MADCVVGCIANYIEDAGKLKKIPIGSVYSPFVEATIDFELTDGETKTVTVGNESSQNGTACIKSFSCGNTDGFKGTLEIVDEEGGVFEKFFCKILNDNPKPDQFKNKIKVRWGWIIAKDDGSPPERISSKDHYFLITQVNIKFEAKVKFILECSDIVQATFEARNSKVYPSDGGKMKLKDAIRQLCKDNKVTIESVKFKKKNSDGEIDPSDDAWDFGCDGINGTWSADGNHVLNIIWQWIKPYKTKDGHGIIVTSSSTESKTNIELWEVNIKQIKNADPIASYIVNGGDCSSVISFVPDIKFSIASLWLSGGFADQTSGTMQQVVPNDATKEMKERQDQGPVVIGQVDDNAKNCYGSDASSEINKASIKHQETNMNISNYNQISAELKLIGDPDLDDSIKLRFAYVAIVVLNPFNIEDIGDGNNDWRISGSACNQVLSRKNWIIQGFAHDIREGSYVTSLKLIANPPASQEFECLK